MNKKWIKYFLISLCVLFPILSVEDIIPWVVSLYFIHKSCKFMKISNDIKPILINTILSGGIILGYNIITKIAENYLVKMWL